MTKAIERTFKSGLLSHFILTVADVDVAQQDTIQGWGEPVDTLTVFHPVVFVDYRHDSLIVRQLVVFYHITQFVPVIIVTDYEATCVVVLRSSDVVEFHHVLVIVPGGTLDKCLSESWQCQRCRNYAHRVARTRFPAPECRGTAAYSINDRFILIAVKQRVVNKRIAALALGKLLFHGYRCPTLVFLVGRTIDIALYLKIVAIIEIIPVGIVHRPRQTDHAIG